MDSSANLTFFSNNKRSRPHPDHKREKKKDTLAPMISYYLPGAKL